jgi:hypothetical protein
VSTFDNLRETCHCGHDKATHYRDAADGARISCLAIACDCPKYVNERDPKPKAKLVRPKHRAGCECRGCREYAEQEGIAIDAPIVSDYAPYPSYYP